MNDADSRNAPARLTIRGLVIVGVAAFVAFVVATMPARVALALVGGDAVRASGVSGSIWNGRATAIAVRDIAVGQTRWQFRPSQLLRLRAGIGFETRPPGGTVQGNAAIGPTGTLWLDDLRGVLPVSALQGLMQLPAPDGNVGISIDRARLTDGWPDDVVGTVDLANLVVTLAEAVTLGSFEIVFDGGNEDGVSGHVTDVESPLTVTGNIALEPGRTWRIGLDIAPKPGAPKALTDGLTFLTGPPRGTTHRLEADGTL